MNIWYGSRENVWLSNLYQRPFCYADCLEDNAANSFTSYYSVEHAYQTLKSGKFDCATYKNQRWKVSGTKIMGRRSANTIGNWNMKLMHTLIYESFYQNPKFGRRLCDSTATFTHRQDRGVWREAFPKILMDVRDDLRLNIDNPI